MPAIFVKWPREYTKDPGQDSQRLSALNTAKRRFVMLVGL